MWLLTMNAVTRSDTLISSIFSSFNLCTYSAACTTSHTTPTPPGFSTLTISPNTRTLSAAAAADFGPNSFPTVCTNTADTTTSK